MNLDDGSGDEDNVEAAVDPIELIKKAVERPTVQDNDPYINCDFILCSSAEVERVWSMCLNLLTMSRAGMFPITLEAIIYLKYNKSWWGMAEVQEALNNDEIDGLNEDMEAVLNMADDEEDEFEEEE